MIDKKLNAALQNIDDRLGSMSNESLAKAQIDGAIIAYELTKTGSMLKRCISKYGSKFVWKHAGEKMQHLGLKEEDLPINDKEFLYEEHDMEN